jgi:NADPH-dependent 2,4-dienoyl-CoA reductase/sulfur reductase-like enzyme/rhodanese-related sulfurtransferase
MSALKIAIIGGVAAGASAAAKARRCSEAAEIVMFEKGNDISYATCGLPYYLSGIIKNRRQLLVTSVEFFRQRFKVDVRTGQEVTAIDRESKKITVVDHGTGREYGESYDRLILAPGAEPVMPQIPGIDLPLVFTMKTLADTDRIYSFLNNKRPLSAVVIGGGLIGMEMAENLVGLGIRTAVVEFMPQLLTFLDWEMSEVVASHARRHGLELHLGEKVTRVTVEKGQGRADTDQGRILAADLVIAAVGVRPNTALARQAGITIGRTGGVAVNEFMQTSDPHIWAAGDCVESINMVTGKPAFIPLGSAANKQGRAAGANACGRNIPVKGFLGTVIVKVFDLAVAKTGLNEREAAGAGYKPLVTYVIAEHHAGYYPGAKDIWIKTVADAESGRLLGAQIVGEEGVDKRIDVMATAIYNRMAAADLIHLDLAYAPPYSSARDPVVVVGALYQNYMAGDWQPITPAALFQRIQAKDDFILVDVRTGREVQREGIIEGAVHIPVDELRQRLQELDRAKEVVLYCAVGMRSYIANRILAQHDFDKVFTLTGGAEGWPYGLRKPDPHNS